MEQSLRVMLYGMPYRRLLEEEMISLQRKFGLCRIDIQILVYLHGNSENNTSKDILDRSHFNKGHISQSLARLTKQGLITTLHDPNDRRCVHIYITDKAKTVIDGAKSVYEKVSRVVFSGISDDERKIFTSVAKKINNNINSAIIG